MQNTEKQYHICEYLYRRNSKVSGADAAGWSEGVFLLGTGVYEKEVGEQNIISAVVRVDEKTHHLHLCFTPITEDKRLSAKEIIGNKPKLIEWQDKFHDFMAQR